MHLFFFPTQINKHKQRKIEYPVLSDFNEASLQSTATNNNNNNQIMMPPLPTINAATLHHHNSSSLNTNNRNIKQISNSNHIFNDNHEQRMFQSNNTNNDHNQHS